MFGVDYHGEPFRLFGVAHLATLAVVALALVGLAQLRTASDTTRARARTGLVVVSWVNEVLWHLWQWRAGIWDLQNALPLQLCSISVWLGGVMLLTRSYRIYEIAYFLTSGGAVQALLTPDLGPYGFPHYRYLMYVLAHGLLLAFVVWMTAVEGMRPTRRSVVRTVVVANLLALTVLGIDLALGANYMFLARKPASASVLDLLPPWPYYLVWMEVIALVWVALAWLPWEVADARRRRR